MKISIIRLGLVVGAVVALVLGFVIWKSATNNRPSNKSYEYVYQLLNNAQYNKALAIIQAQRKEHKTQSQKDHWLDLEIEVLTEAGYTARLFWLYERNPKQFTKHEKASLLVQRILLQMRDKKSLQQLSQAWQGRQTHPGWLLLEVDQALMEGRETDALALLHSKKFGGAEDTGRLTRLAMLNANNFSQSWKYLQQAFEKNPKNPEIRSFRGQVLESAGKTREARVEYVAAYLSAPNNPLYHDQLGEFYRRHGNYTLGLQTWADGLTPPTYSFFWIKTYFWRKMAHPIPVNWHDQQRPDDPLRPFLDYLLALPPEQYWNEEAFQELASAHIFEQRQEVFWLRLVQLLKNKKEEQALDLLRLNPFREQSWHPQIEMALKQVLTYRTTNHFHTPKQLFKNENKIKHQFFTTLDQVAEIGQEKLSPSLKYLILSDEVFSMVFLAGGWREAALYLHHLTIVPNHFPEWVAYGLGQTLRFNRSNTEALAFVRKQSPSPALTLLEGELWLAEGLPEKAKEKWVSLYRQNSGPGYRAAWLLSMMALEKQNSQAARHYVQNNTLLSSRPNGQEILAKAALLDNKPKHAQKIYHSIRHTSMEAKAYLAQHAFQTGKLGAAETYTLQLLSERPDNMQLHTNLKTIRHLKTNRGG